jgi:hypothetical protein
MAQNPKQIAEKEIGKRAITISLKYSILNYSNTGLVLDKKQSNEIS